MTKDGGATLLELYDEGQKAYAAMIATRGDARVSARDTHKAEKEWSCAMANLRLHPDYSTAEVRAALNERVRETLKGRRR
jgi:predicted negative regulator of RcsB-dependent stress response